MAKGSSGIIKMVSTANTGYFYITRKGRHGTVKLKLKKYDPVIRKHVEFVEDKIGKSK